MLPEIRKGLQQELHILLAAVIAGVQIGVIAGQPLRPTTSSKPYRLHLARLNSHKAVLLCRVQRGTGITLPNGAPGLVAEAGIPEVILPL
ncbi:hypothetical protein [Treponema phagedenis]|uniref:hypothetical protein n=1 Tax=Treponema phagedenis TaxID=162 RepID=UPI00209199D8|nr:hypothetical protein [Treponema phagedenis]